MTSSSRHLRPPPLSHPSPSSPPPPPPPSPPSRFHSIKLKIKKMFSDGTLKIGLAIPEVQLYIYVNDVEIVDTNTHSQT